MMNEELTINGQVIQPSSKCYLHVLGQTTSLPIPLLLKCMYILAVARSLLKRGKMSVNWNESSFSFTCVGKIQSTVTIFPLSIYTLSDLGNSSNLIG